MIKSRRLHTSAAVAVFSLSLVPSLSAVEAAYIHIVKNETPGTQLHLGEIEAFVDSTVPDDLGGATFGGLTTSTNDLTVDGVFGLGNLYPTIGTTNTVQHGNVNNTFNNNSLENAGAVWSTLINQATNAQYTLDLDGTFDVTTIRMWPRADTCCAERWQNLEIQLLDENQVPIPGSMQLYTPETPNTKNVALEFTYLPEATPIADMLLNPATTYPLPENAVVLSSAAIGSPVGDLQALLAIAGELIPTSTFSLVNGDGDTDNGLYSIGGVNNQQLLVNSNLASLTDVTHSVRIAGMAGTQFEAVFTFTVKADTDGDDLIDDWETTFGTLADFATGADHDGDNLNDEVEFVLGSNPDDSDSDGDGSDDDEEVANQTDLNDPDSDDDDLNDGDEATAGSNPLDPDTDNDSIPDGEEATNGADGVITSPILADSDGDGFLDNVEIAATTDPNSSASRPNIASVRGRFIEIVKNDTVNTRFHLSEIEVFAPGSQPTGTGGGNGGMSTNDLIDLLPLTATRYLGAGTPTTTNSIQHGSGASQTNNAIESTSAVWSTNPNLGVEPRYVLDLGEEVILGKVRLWGRGDPCCLDRFENFTVNVYSGDENGDPGALVGSVDYSERGPAGNSAPVELEVIPESGGSGPISITSLVPIRENGGAITAYDVTWNSQPGQNYDLNSSPDLIDWTNSVSANIPSGGETTTARVLLNTLSGDLSKMFFRVEESGL